MTISRRHLIQSTGAGALLAMLGERAFAQAQIETLKIITGFAAGGTSDTTCRRVATRLSPDYAKTAVVENRTGAGGQIAIQYVKGAPADGATMLQTPTSMLTIYPHIYKKLPYDPQADLTPVSLGCVFDFGFAVGPAVPLGVKTVPDFLAWAKANPLGANFGSPAAGSTPHFVGALLGKSAGIELKHAAYRGTQPAMLDLLGGQISAVSGPIGDITQHLPTGKVRILGVSGAKRSRFAPDVPTLTEQGLKDMAYSEWFAFFLPPKAPQDVVARLNAGLKSALASKDVIDGLNGFGLEALSSTPAELSALIKKDTAMWAPIVKSIGFTADA
ncbi:Bug family tripartite tricarboxylate transporter substrate binding protein [Variovorax terrae]|uniref:Bug family tripartite tricarboxylate transporter substrate binding protein n=1 Tax=Variovorax terrae TaxID=2923278 RepID=A0A9X1VY49_9BURK|nr:Bug family tripartite tricarboxylate transporter substrate binding protein [Variovorax terrae]MCJ0765460.1 Bug family tripartite tricarboxylate transporter substrate binding protein [Variovorax terrae]